MSRFGTLGLSRIGKFSLPQIRKRALNSWSAIQDTFYLITDTFERHKVVFTISTSVASVATAWAGYTLHHLRETKVERRLDSIENAMKSNYHIEHNEFKKLVGSSSSTTAHVVTAGTSLIIGYGLGWRGGIWSANRKFRKEQMKFLGQKKPRRWLLRFLRRPLTRPKLPDIVVKTSVALAKDARDAHTTNKAHPVC